MAVCSLCFTSCLSDLDNYESPNGGIKGQILDAETNEPIPLLFRDPQVLLSICSNKTQMQHNRSIFMQRWTVHTKMRSCSTVIIKLWLTARLFLLAKNL